MFTLAKLAQFTDTETKNFQQILPKIPYGASGENRTLISSLENLHTSRCTTLAYRMLWGGILELNQRPSGPQSDALTN